jgi:aerobic-type carbon monoxide dehydrogenase small subunit (CoxS/CutS family)
VNSCLVLASRVTGRTVVTLEGLLDSEIVQRLQRNFIESNALQCGFCTPGILVTLYALLEANPIPSEDEIETAIEGNLCRCGAYLEIEKAVSAATGTARGPSHT